MGLRVISASEVVVNDGFYHIKSKNIFARHLHVVVLGVGAAEHHERGVGQVAAKVFDHAVVFKHNNVDLSPKDAIKIGDASDGDEAAIVDDRNHAVARDAEDCTVAGEVGEGDAAYDTVVGEEAAQLYASGGDINVVNRNGVTERRWCGLLGEDCVVLRALKWETDAVGEP